MSREPGIRHVDVVHRSGVQLVRPVDLPRSGALSGHAHHHRVVVVDGGVLVGPRGLPKVLDHRVGTPDHGGVLGVRGGRVVVVHPDVVGGRAAGHLGHPDPDVRRACFVPQLDLVSEQGGVVRVDEADVLAGVLGAEVLDVGAVEANEHREVVEVGRLAAIVEGDLAAQAPRGVPPCGCGGRSDDYYKEERSPQTRHESAGSPLHKTHAMPSHKYLITKTKCHREKETEERRHGGHALFKARGMPSTSPSTATPCAWRDLRSLSDPQPGAAEYGAMPAHSPAVLEQHGLTTDEYDADPEGPRPRAQPDRARALLRDVVRALLLQEQPGAPASTLPTEGPAGGAGPGGERGGHRHRRRARRRLQDRVAQPPVVHRALPGRGHRRGRHPARHLHHGRAPDRRAQLAALRPPRRPEDPPHPRRRGERASAATATPSAVRPWAARSCSSPATRRTRWSTRSAWAS